MSTSSDSLPSTGRSTQRQRISTSSPRPSAPTKAMVPAVIFIPCQVQILDRWSPDATSSSNAEDCCMKKSPSFRRDEENAPASCVFPTRTTVSIACSTRSAPSSPEDELENSMDSVDDRAVRRCSATSSNLGCQASSTKSSRRSSFGPPTLPRRQRSNVALDLM